MRKCECLFKLCGYRIEDETFNVISGIHNHVMHDKIVSNSIVCHLVSEERKLVGAKKHTHNFEMEKTSKCFKYLVNIRCVCSRQQDG